MPSTFTLQRGGGGWAAPERPLRYYASCASGLEAVLAAELSGPRVRATAVRAGARGVQFEGTAEVGYNAMLWSRTANKVGLQLPRSVFFLYI